MDGSSNQKLTLESGARSCRESLTGPEVHVLAAQANRIPATGSPSEGAHSKHADCALRRYSRMPRKGTSGAVANRQQGRRGEPCLGATVAPRLTADPAGNGWSARAVDHTIQFMNPSALTTSTADAATYALVAKAIHYLQCNVRRQPSLSDLASHLDVSESTLQRAFSAFAGVSPKRFLQFHTKEHAKALLLDSADVLTAALEAGLSGPGRLHALMISTEAMTPGEIGRGGRDVVLRYAYAETPLGQVLAACTPRGLAFLGFVEPQQEAAAMADLRARWPAASLIEDAGVADMTAQVFAGWRSDRPLHLVLAGTNFQIKVWEALLAIPEGHLASYTQLARAVGRPDAVRAVASAVGRNPLSVLIPCHRVIRESGTLGGYHWGLARKGALIALESARRERFAQVA